MQVKLIPIRRVRPAARCTLLCSLLFALPGFGAHWIDWLSDLSGENSGHTVCGFLNLPLSAQELGRGASSYSGAMDATDASLYPANMALANRYSFAGTHLEWLSHMRKEYLGALIPILDVGTFGAFAQLFTPGPIEYARDIDERPSHPDYAEYCIGLSYGRAFFDDMLSAGLAVSYLESRIDDLAGRTVTGNLHIRYEPFPAVNAHLYAASFGKDLSYSNDRAEPLPGRIGCAMNLRPLGLLRKKAGKFDAEISAGVTKRADEPVIAGAGAELSYNSMGRVRFGYEQAKGVGPSLHGMSAGAGLTIQGFDIDGGWRSFSREFGPVWAITIGHKREELKRRTAEDYYDLALRHYGKKRHFLATFNAQRALQLDPNMWKAHALISKVASDRLRAARREIAIVYTGNSQGAFVAPHESVNPGGFARQAAVIARLRREFPLTVVIEAGNMMTEKMLPRRVEFAASYLNYIRHDAMGCGAGELAFGMKKLVDATDGDRTFVLSNAAKAISGVKQSHIVEKDGYRFFVASYCAKEALGPKSGKTVSRFDANDIATAGKGCDLRILVCHDTWENLRRAADGFTGFDILICGNCSQRFPAPIRTAGPLVLSPGEHGEYVGCLVVRFDEKRKVVSMDNRLFALQADMPIDTAVDAMIRKLSAESIPPDAIDTMTAMIDGTFAFVSDRTGRDEIYLKRSSSMAEFPLTRNISDTCDNPVLSFNAGMIACRALMNGWRRLLLMRLDGTDMRYVADSLETRGAAFTPDGAWLYYAAARFGDTLADLYRVRPHGGPSFGVVTWNDGSESAPAFSPDGNMMVFGSDRDGSMQLYLTNMEAQQPVRITDDRGSHVSPAFSPDGNMIAYLCDSTNFNGRLDLWIFDRRDGTHHRMTQRSDVKEFCWLGDSRTIIYVMGSVTDKLARVNIVDFRFDRLVKTDGPRTWHERNPQTVRIDGREMIVYERHYPKENERQLYRIAPDGSGDTRIVGSPGRDGLAVTR